MDFKRDLRVALDEIDHVFQTDMEREFAQIEQAVSQARRIALHGVGREGLMMKALAMRLFHLGLEASVVGDMTTPHIGQGDLLMVSAGPGSFATIAALVNTAHAAGATTLCFSAVPDGQVPEACDIPIIIPAQTMANDQSAVKSILPMGSLYEAAIFLFFEFLILRLQRKLKTSAETMRSNHTNLE